MNIHDERLPRYQTRMSGSKMSDTNNTSSNTKVWQRCPLHNAEYFMVLNFPSQTYYINYVIGLTCNIVLIILAIILNSATVLTYWRSAQLRNKTSYFLIMLLCAVDLTTAVVGHFIFVLNLVFTIHGNPNCTIVISHEILTFSTVSMSFATLFALNFERYLSILHPFFHRTKMTKPRLLSLAACCWFGACVVTVSHPILGLQVARQMASYIIVFEIGTTLFMYISICRAVRKAASNSPHANGNQLKKLQNVRMTKSCAIVVACSVICFLPFAVNSSLEKSIFVVVFMDLWGKTFTLISSSLNPLVFFWRNPILRKEAKVVLKIH